MSYRTYTWRAGSMGEVLRRIPIYRASTLPNGNEIERILVCEITGMYQGQNDWLETIVNAPQTKSEHEQLVKVVEAVKQRLEARQEQPCRKDGRWVCSLLNESGLRDLLKQI